MYKVELLTVNDLDEIVELENLCFDADGYSKAFFIEMFQDERTIAFAVKDNKKLIAMLFAYNWVGVRNYLKLISIGVHPDYRNKGLAKEFMRISFDIMNDYQLTAISAETRASNKAMQSVFEAFGYRIERRVKDYYDNPNEDALRYVFNKKVD
jgi:ribosomal protein S18 acetylase RimI-like enzyme